MSEAALTTSSPESSVARVTTRLRRLRGRITLWFLVDGLGRVLWTLLLLIAADLAVDWLFELDKPSRIIMLVLCAGVLLYVAGRRMAAPLMRSLGDDALCLQVEERHRELGQGLISALQFSRMSDFESRGVSPRLAQATIDRGLNDAERVDFDDVIDRRRFRRNLAILAGALVALGGVGWAVAATKPLGIWFNRNVLLGDARWPQDTYLIVEGVEDGRLIVPRGDDWPLKVTVDKAASEVDDPQEVSIEFDTSAGSRSELMEKTDDGSFHYTLKNVVDTFLFRVSCPSGHTDWIAVELVDRPAVADLQLTVSEPDYAGGRTVELPAGQGPYYVLKGSRLQLRGTATKPLSAAVLEVGAERRDMRRDGERGFSIELPPEKLAAGTYRVHLTDTERIRQPGQPEPGPLTSKRPTRFTIREKPDRRPQLRLSLTGISSMVVPGAVIPCTVRITDDFAVTAVRRRTLWKSEEETVPPTIDTLAVEEANDQLGGAVLGFDHAVEVSSLKIPAGSGLALRFEADDNDTVSGPKTGQSTEILLRVVTEDELRTDLLRREKEQRQEFERLLKQQIDIQTETEVLLAEGRNQSELTAEQRQQLQRLQKRQKLLGQNLANIAEKFSSIVIEVLNNRLEKEDGPLIRRLRERIIEPMSVLAGTREPQPNTVLARVPPIPVAARLLDQARRLHAQPGERDAALLEALAAHKQIVAVMEDVLKFMVKTEDFQEAVNLLYEIQKHQSDVYKQTIERHQEKIRKILEQGGKTDGESSADSGKKSD